MKAKYVAAMLVVLLMSMLSLGVQAQGPAEGPTGFPGEPPFDNTLLTVLSANLGF